MGKQTNGVKVQSLDNFFNHLANDLEATPFQNPLRGAAVERLMKRMRKRAEFTRPELKEQAVRRFVETNESVIERLPDEVEPFLNEARDFIHHVLVRYMAYKYPFTYQETFVRSAILDGWRFGPGASKDSVGYGTVSRFDQQWTITKSDYVASFIRQIRQENPYLRSFDAAGMVPRLVEGMRLTTVLKNEEQERTIGIEPSGNMALQLAAASVLEGVLRMAGIDLKTQQPKNKRLARLGSRDGSIATVDMKSASDLISRCLIEATWPPEWVRFFTEVRSPVAELPDGSVCTLKMMSTMGNGCTFPMMTLTFLALVYANRRLRHRGPRRFINLENTAVFGDDIIIPSQEYDGLVQLLTACGLVVNTDKSYAKGPFRESCGGDYYLGYDVTPFYVKRLDRAPDVYTAINQLLRWSARTQVSLPRSLRFLISLLHNKVHLVPQWLSDYSGIRCAQCPRMYKPLMAIPVKVRYVGLASLPLAIGGFISNDKDGHHVYVPRREALQYKVGKARLPEGYLDGWDPSYGSYAESAWIDREVALAL